MLNEGGSIPMSASREKRERKQEVAPAEPVKRFKRKTSKTSGKLGDRFYAGIAIAIAAVIVLSLGISFFQNVVSGGNSFKALDVGEDKVYPQEVNFYYVNSYMNFINSYGDYLSYMGLDKSKPLKSQKYSDDKTWHDYFLDQAANSVQQIKMLVHDAQAKGVVLDDASKEQIDASVKSIESSASGSNSNSEAYLASYYGKGMTLDEYKRILGETLLAQQYGKQVRDSYKYSDKDMSTYYEANKKDFDVVDYRSFFFSSAPTTDKPTEGDTAAAKAAAKSKADIMASSVTDEKAFIELCKQNAPDEQKDSYNDDAASLQEGAAYADISSSAPTIADWLFDTARVGGDTTVLETENGYYVLYMKARYRNDYNTANVRHILVKYELAQDAKEPNAEQKTAAKTEAESILKEWKDGAATEDSFGKLATERTDDTGSASNGGLYEDVHKGQMVAPFENWAFDPSRKTGDTGIVETTYGYHVMYYVSSGSPYWTIQVDSAMRDKDYAKFSDALKEKYPIKEHAIGMMSVGIPGK